MEMNINLSPMEAVELVGKIHKLLDRTEWDSGTTADIAELLDAYGVEVREPCPDRNYWSGPTTEYAAQHIDNFRICVWQHKGDLFGEHYMGVQVWNMDLRYDDNGTDPFTTFYMKRDPEADLDDMLDGAIEKWESLRA